MEKASKNVCTSEVSLERGKGKVWKVMGYMIYFGAQIAINELWAFSLMPTQSLVLHTQHFC